jgi:predicted CXXCH cytochrome family protein
VFVCTLLWASAQNSWAQQLDTAIFSEPAAASTILDQIEQPQERRAFAALYKKGDPGKRLKSAEAFLSEYPDSWMLPEVYELAAQASISLHDPSKAILYGTESLRLLPENPLLLVPLANVQEQQHKLRDAGRSAQDALDYLERFDRPNSVRETEWPAVRADLQASALCVLGKISVAEGLAAQGDARCGKLKAAATDFTEASQLDPQNPESAYLLGLVALALDDRELAGRAFAAATRQPGPRQEQALSKLRELHHTAADYSPFEMLPHREPSETPPAEYAGSDACRDCHAGEHAAWQHTGMARMFRPVRPENIIGDFSQRQFQDRKGTIVARMGIDKDRYYFATRGEDGVWQQYSIDYTIGSKWQQAYATQLPDGQIHVFPIQYNKLERAWVNYWRIIDPPGSQRPDPDRFHNMSSRTNYQANCAPCHTSQLHSRNARSADRLTLLFREPGVNCEMCHGPSARHVALMRAGGHASKPAAEPPIDFAGIDNRQFVAVCAQCHMQSAIRRPGLRGEENYSESAGMFPLRYLSRPYPNFSHRAFYKDGRFRETTFIVEAFMRSACYRKGQAQCGNCHNPHPTDAASNPTSLKYREQPDQMCLQCHSDYVAKVEAHTHHAPTSEGSRCVSCHMPRIMNSLLFQARTHQIDDIPRADLTLRFGPQESPNACLMCHREKDAQWAATRLQSWSCDASPTMSQKVGQASACGGLQPAH